MAEITKFNVYLNEHQTRKLNMLATTTGREPEELLNDSAYSYLAIADPFAEDREPEEGMHEILFEIPEEVADQMMKTLHLDDYDALDEYVRSQVLAYFSPQQDGNDKK